VKENGHHAVEVNDVIAIALIAELRRDEMDSLMKNGQLHLRHGQGCHTATG
jgi:hypothetical protein